ncbi:hypothetical protein GCK32_005278 [Trichostrongylus colubriformis]|uniref:Uncharacterized protein n=1 Tax=Trichostrongylus colubriformis TaxID=6319 RepID=A0AAN8IR21_TRICO
MNGGVLSFVDQLQIPKPTDSVHDRLMREPLMQPTSTGRSQADHPSCKTAEWGVKKQTDVPQEQLKLLQRVEVVARETGGYEDFGPSGKTITKKRSEVRTACEASDIRKNPEMKLLYDVDKTQIGSGVRDVSSTGLTEQATPQSD